MAVLAIQRDHARKMHTPLEYSRSKRTKSGHAAADYTDAGRAGYSGR